ncbi:MAG: NAD(P)H-dependent oxidoreductase [Rhodobiaceae bacterium]|nr:NAD(P)H-dependent oxidoreductase [Rhodobiaceae bacterium]
MQQSKVLVVYCHPCGESFNAAVRDTVTDTLTRAGHQVHLLDLHAEGFDPVMSADERRGYHTQGDNIRPVESYLEQIKWCDALVFVYPTWWFGLPAMLKGWLDRVWVPHETFTMPTEEQGIQPSMTHIRKLACITTCGATWWTSKLIGEPGRRTILRGIRALCDRRCKTLYMAHYKMDTSTPESRTAYLRRIEARLARF